MSLVSSVTQEVGLNNTVAMPSMPLTNDGYAYKLRIVVLSLGVSQIVGAIVIVAQTVNALWNLVLLAKQSILICRESSNKPQTVMAMRLYRDNIVEDLKQNALNVIAAIIGLLPIVGLIGAGKLLVAADPQSISSYSKTNSEKMTEAIACHLFANLPYVKRLMSDGLHTLQGQTLAQFIENKKKAWLDSYKTDAKDNEKKFRDYYQMNKDLPLTEDVIKNIVEKDLQKECLIETNIINKYEGTTLQIPVERGDGQQHHISGIYIKGRGLKNKPSGPTAVVIHGNGMIAQDMVSTKIEPASRSSSYNLIEILHKNGWNVLIPTMGGYPGSDEGSHVSETSVIQDVNAIMQKLEHDGVNIVALHGHSYGGALALHATQISKRIQCLILAKTFDDPINLSMNLANNVLNAFKSTYPILTTLGRALFPPATIRGLVSSLLPVGRQVPGVMTHDGRQYLTDGQNNINKMHAYSGHFCLIKDSNDFFMGCDEIVQENPPERVRILDNDREYRSNIADKLLAAHQSNTIVQTKLKRKLVKSVAIQTTNGHSTQLICARTAGVNVFRNFISLPVINTYIARMMKQWNG